MPGPAYETPSAPSASAILPRHMLSGPDINVDPFVATDGYLYIYNLHTRFGDLRVSSTALLATRVAEMVALARIEQVSARQEFRSGLINKGQQTVAGAVDLATNPLGTLSGAATGVGRAFESLQQKPCARRPGRRLSPGATTIRPALAWWLSRPPATGRNVFTWTLPLTGTPNDDAPSVLNASYNFKAEVEIPASGAEGMLITQGGRFAGYGFYVLKNKPVFLWNLVDLKRVLWEGPELTPGKHVLEFDFAYDGMGAGTLAFNNFSGVGRGGTGVLKVDGQPVDTQTMERTLPFILQWDEALDAGSDTLTGVSDADYQTPTSASPARIMARAASICCCLPATAAPAAGHSGQGFLVRHRLQQPDPVHAPDQPAVPERGQPDQGLSVNADGSVDVYFGPTAPAGKEKNWVQTVPGQGWNTILRLYGPLAPWFDKTWRPGEIELQL